MTKEKESKTEKAGLMKALLELQKKPFLVKKESSNPVFKSKYCDLHSITEACRANMVELGLVVIQYPIVKENFAGCKTVITHAESNESIEGELLLPLVGKERKVYAQDGTFSYQQLAPDAQSVGSCILYARRYSIAPMIGLVPADELDDDGNAASNTDKLKDVKDRDLNKGGSWPTVSGKKYPLSKQPEGQFKTPLVNDDIPEYANPLSRPNVYDATEAAKAVFPDSQEIKIRFKYDIDKLDPKKVEDVEKYIEAQRQNGYVDLDQTTGVIESEIELPKLKRYQTFPD